MSNMTFSPVNVKTLNYNDLDPQIAGLIDQESIDNARREGDKLSQDWGEEKFKELRWLAKNELFFLSETILGYKRLSKLLHGHLCEWVSNTKNFQFREILLPRGHFKSTVLTIAHSIQIVLPDDTKSLPWPLHLGPNCRLLIGHETDSQASKFLFAITQHFLGNPLLMALFPECIPNPRKHKINKNELELPRSDRWPEPTIDTMGVGGKSQGRHYNYLKLDDLFGDKARDSEAERTTTIQWFDNVQSFFSLLKEDKFDLIGTRWALDDLYAHAHNMYKVPEGEEPILAKYIRPVHEYRRNEEGHIVKDYIFPEEFNDKVVQVLKKNRKVWTAQYLNDPKEGANEFSPDWKQQFQWDDTRNIRFIDRITGQEDTVNIRNLDICILVDPADTGEYGYVITGSDIKDRVFVLKAVEEIWKANEFMDYLFLDVMRYQPRVVGIESVLFSILYQFWARAEMRLRNTRFTIEELKVKKQAKDKELRVKALGPYFSAYKIFFSNTNQTLLQEQYDAFGSISSYHILDALAHGPQLWRKPNLALLSQASTTQQLAQNRDPVYGYSPV